MLLKAPGRPRWLIPTVVAAVLATAAGVVVGLRLARSGGGVTDPACQRPVAPLSASTQPASPGLAVAEHGYGRTGNTVSIGGVLVNTSGQAAYRTRVTFRVLNAAGASLAQPDLASLLYQEIPVILPGQRLAVGALVSMHDEDIRAINRVTVELGSTRWVPTDPADPLYRPHTVTLTTPSTPGSVDFTVTGGGCAGLVERGFGVVFRDTTGTVVGGALDFGAANGRCAGVGGPQTTPASHAPPTADLTKTQISIYCDVAGAPRDLSGATPPAN